MLLRRIALGLAVAALVVVAGLVLVAAAVERVSPQRGGAASPTAELMATPTTAATETGPGARSAWATVRVGPLSYAVPPAWARRPAGERVAYREDGAVIAAGRGQSLLSAGGCPVAWAVLADPVAASNPSGVAEATALAWARGYAGLPSGAGLEASPAEAVALAGGSAERSRVEVDLAEGSGCAGERAELTAVARRSGDQVVALVVARYLDVPGTPSDAAYDGVLGSFGAG